MPDSLVDQSRDGIPFEDGRPQGWRAVDTESGERQKVLWSKFEGLTVRL